jgi:hypothetical protein
MTFRRVTRHELVGAGLAPPSVNCMHDRAAVRKTLKRTRVLSLRTVLDSGNGIRALTSVMTRMLHRNTETLLTTLSIIWRR